MYWKLSLVIAAIFGIINNTEGGLVDGFFKKAFDQMRPNLTDMYVENMSINKLQLKNLAIQGLEKFYTTSLNVALLPMKINNMTIVIDDVRATARYRMDNMAMPANIVVSGAGDVDLHIKGIIMYIKAPLRVANKIITLADIQEMTLTVDYIGIDMTGLAGGGPVGDLLNNILKLAAGPMVNILAAENLMPNKDKLMLVINQILSQIKV